jgi:epoxyqueuosine reductase
MTTSISEAIRAEALRLGFDVCGISDAAAPWEAGERLAQFVEHGRHGAMDWMQTTVERRSHPQAMWRDARSAIMLGVNYGPDTDPMLALADKSRGAVSVYAHGEDYHEPIKKRLKVLAGWIAATYGAQVKVFVDTAPLMEKPLAHQAGLGWQGKHTNLVSRQFGSWLFLGAILTELDLTPDAPSGEHCGGCTACLDVCPTNAFPAPFQLDARRCLAASTAATTAWPSAPGTSSPRSPARPAFTPATRCAARCSPTSPGWTTPPSAPCSPRARSSASAATASSAMWPMRWATAAIRA